MTHSWDEVEPDPNQVTAGQGRTTRGGCKGAGFRQGSFPPPRLLSLPLILPLLKAHRGAEPPCASAARPLLPHALREAAGCQPVSQGKSGFVLERHGICLPLLQPHHHP